MKKLLAAAASLIVCAAQGQIVSTLHARDINNDGSIDAFYDATQDITWLADANYIATSGYPPAIGPGGVPVGSPESDFSPGTETWSGANDWAQSLEIHGIGAWRLPNVFAPDPQTCAPYAQRPCDEYDSYASELTVLAQSLAGTSGPFLNVQTYYYTGLHPSRWFPAPGVDWSFQMVNVQAGTSVGNPQIGTLGLHAWAVRDGDVATAVPEPSTYALTLAGFAVLALVARRRKCLSSGT